MQQLAMPCAMRSAFVESRRIGAGSPRCGRHGRLAASASSASQQPNTLVKICGVTNPVDAEAAAKAGADFIGMIMWPKAKRHVPAGAAAAIVRAAHEYGARAVGVYVDEDAATILHTSQQAGLDLVQLHGDTCRQQLLQLDASIPVVYVMQATPEGSIVTPTPTQLPGAMPGGPAPRGVEWLLLDGMQGGGGQALDWTRLSPPKELASQGWLLAGGLRPDNVAEAVRLMVPTGVDVSSGVCGPDGLHKDHSKVVAFIQAAKSERR